MTEPWLPDDRPEVSKLGLRALAVIAGGSGSGEVPSGSVVCHRLANEYDADVGESRVYQILGDLVDQGLVAKRRSTNGDGRTKRFAITDAGREVLRAEVAWLAALTPGLSLAEPDVTERTHDGARPVGDD